MGKRTLIGNKKGIVQSAGIKDGKRNPSQTRGTEGGNSLKPPQLVLKGKKLVGVTFAATSPAILMKIRSNMTKTLGSPRGRKKGS